MNTQIEELLSDNEDLTYATDQKYDSSDRESIQEVTVTLVYVVCLCGVMV